MKRFSAFICMLMGIVLSWNISAQNQTISFPEERMKISEAFGVVEKQSGLSIAYNEDLLDVSRVVSLPPRKKLTEAISAILEGTGTKATYQGKLILIVKAEAPQDGMYRQYSGIVTDDAGPVAGAVVMIGNGQVNTVTAADGSFSIRGKEGDILKVSMLGYKEAAIPLGSRTSGLELFLSMDQNILDEVVVIGYGTLEKKQVTSSITSISSKDLIVGQGGSTIATALKGKISGMTINETSSPNTTSSFQLRGVASINASASPLVVVDGMPGADIRSINFEDVLSIDVLKDGSAGAIYGTRAAGGVILITTKKANEGPLKLSYTAELSTEQTSNRPELLSAKDFLRFGMGSDYGEDNDWYGALLNEWAFSHKHIVNLTGGGHNAKIYATFTASDQKGIAIGDARKDYSGRINGSFKLLDDILEVDVHSEYRQANRDVRASTSNFNMAMKMNPTEPIYDSENESGYNVITGGSDYYNPLADIMLRQNDKTDIWILADANLKLNLPYGLSGQVSMGWQHRQMQATRYVSSLHKSSIDNARNGEAYHEFNKTVDLSIEPTINFDRSFGDHTINAVVGYSFWETNSESFSQTNYDFPVDGTGAWDMQAGSWLKDGKAYVYSHKYPRTRLISFFGRVNYNWKSRYMLSASIRHEGSSKFGKDHRWGDFWAVSGGWRISSERWMKALSPVLDDLKVRVGYGVTGNNGFSSGQTAFRYASGSLWPMNGDWIMSYGPGNNVNYDLHWEEKSELNVGVDYSFFGGRLNGKFDWYHRWVSGMIYNITVSTPPALYDNTVMNYGNLENWGWEFEIGGIPVRKGGFEWSTAMRFSNNQSQVTSLWGNHTYQDRVSFPAPGAPGSGGRLENGTKIGQYYLWKSAGFTEDGKWLIYNKDGDVILADNKTYEDKRYIGNAIPSLIVSWDNTFRYKDLYLNVALRSWLNYDVFNTINMYYGLSSVSGQNVLRSAFIENRNIKQDKVLTDYWLEDGSFLKIDAISLGYSLNMKKWQRFIDKIELYATIRNVACLTGYSGLNPEVNINGLDPGYEWFTLYPETRRYTFGIKVVF
ncbi:MAG: SusC/RagA family TonB-linked outer membrane protein [Candidatus Cryptobacteroides sp.]